MKSISQRVLLPALLLGVNMSAHAQAVSGYLSIGLGHAVAEKPASIDSFQKYHHQIDGTSSSNRSDTAYKLVAGLKFNSYFSIEAQYVDLGKSSYKGEYVSKLSLGGVGGAPPNDTIMGRSREKVSFKTQSFGANLVATYPIDDLIFFTKIGYHLMKTKASWSYSSHGAGRDPIFGNPESIIGQPAPRTHTKKNVSSWAPSFGLGFIYPINDQISILAEYERFDGVANKKMSNTHNVKTNIKHNNDFASMGLRYTF